MILFCAPLEKKKFPTCFVVATYTAGIFYSCDRKWTMSTLPYIDKYKVYCDLTLI